MGFHAFRLIDDDDMLILIEFFDQTRVSAGSSFRVIVRVKDQLDLVSFLNGALPVDGLAMTKTCFLVRKNAGSYGE